MYIIPIVALQYLFAFIDRANIGNARLGMLRIFGSDRASAKSYVLLAGLEKDLKLVKYDYNLLLSSESRPGANDS
jgi:hypothetical protein